MLRMQEDVVDCRRRERKYVNEVRMGVDEWRSVRLLDLKKAYVRGRNQPSGCSSGDRG